jgi:hypothetical protein
MKFPSLTGAPVFFRTYSRKLNGTLELETPEEAIARSLTGTDSEILTEEEKQLQEGILYIVLVGAHCFAANFV